MSAGSSFMIASAFPWTKTTSSAAVEDDDGGDGNRMH